MPELPEVETIKRDLKLKIINKEIKAVHVVLPKIIKNRKDIFVSGLLHVKFIDIKRRGKLLIFYLNKKDKFMFLHLRMTGQLIYKNKKKIIAGGHSNVKDDFDLPNKHTRLWFELSGGGKLFFNDMRQFGYVELADKDKKGEVLARFGPEPFTENFSLQYLQKILKKRKINIKAVLLDQRLIAGIGNIYADESLFMARILPWRSAKSLTREEIVRLRKAIQNILKKAIKYRGTTFNDYVDANGQKGNFLSQLNVYQRTGKKCLRCNKTEIKKTKIAGRSTHYCQVCQK